MNQSARSFYSSKRWNRARKKVLARDNYLCQRCYKKGLLTPAEVVHHIDHLRKAPGKVLDESNLISVCSACHNKVHPEKGKKGEVVRKARVVRVERNEERV
jgi:5-methylcytosine-specific restriction enzyme A